MGYTALKAMRARNKKLLGEALGPKQPYLAKGARKGSDLKSAALRFLHERCEGLRFDPAMTRLEKEQGIYLGTGIRPNQVKYGLAGFNGAGRRFEFKGKFNGADVYDDYAHHPGELRALLDMVQTEIASKAKGEHKLKPTSTMLIESDHLKVWQKKKDKKMCVYLELNAGQDKNFIYRDFMQHQTQIFKLIDSTKF